ncbi:LacI family DNA-binding transcriptional regulator [Isoptericola sp. NPDC056134]|uniref:LacI family DNA-binding transcriptional regulator n=1 Tax=Isoptericola sp. NPDC056134 TaxID=3345723 RepID=UPI0035E6E29C
MSQVPRVKPPVIADVARVAGVSVPTVSRVLNGTVPVSAERRERVMAAVKKLGFRPNGAARSLASQAGSMIAVFAGNTTRYGYAATIQGIEEAARQAGYMVVISVVETADGATVERAIDHALGQPLAGAVVLEFDPPGVAALAQMPSWLPAVAAASGGSSDEAISHAYMDDRHAAIQATRYLLDLGHRTVHHVAIPSMGVESARMVGWREALRDAGIEPPPVIHAGWDPLAGYDAGVRLARDDDATAVLAGNDELAIGVMKGLVDSGRSIPGDVSVIGFDDHPLSQLWVPPLTTVRQDFVGLGHQVFGLLVGRMEAGEPRPSVRMVPDLVVRQSTGRPASR